MKRTEFVEWFNQNVKSRWPKWELNDCILADWFSVLGGYDAVVLNEAVRRHRIYDDPAAPSTRKLLEIVRQLQPPRAKRPVTEIPKEPLTEPQYWQKVRSSSSKEERIEAICRMWWYPRARDKDPQAYDWAIEQGLIQRSADSVQRSAFSGQRSAFSVQRSADSVQRSAFSGQRSAFSVQRTAFSGHHNSYTPRADAWGSEMNCEREHSEPGA